MTSSDDQRTDQSIQEPPRQLETAAKLSWLASLCAIPLFFGLRSLDLGAGKGDIARALISLGIVAVVGLLILIGFFSGVHAIARGIRYSFQEIVFEATLGTLFSLAMLLLFFIPFFSGLLEALER